MGMFDKMKNFFLTDEAKARAEKKREEKERSDSVVDEDTDDRESAEASSEVGSVSDEVTSAEKRVVKKVVKKKVVKKVPEKVVEREVDEELERKRLAFEAEQEEIRVATEERRKAVMNRDVESVPENNSIDAIRRRLNNVEESIKESDIVTEHVTVEETVDESFKEAVEGTVDESFKEAVDTRISGSLVDTMVEDVVFEKYAKEREEERKKAIVLKKREEEERYYEIMMDLPPRSLIDEVIMDALGAGIPEWYLRDQGIIVDEEDAFKDIVSKVVVDVEGIRKSAGLVDEASKTVVEFDASSAVKLAETLGSVLPVSTKSNVPLVDQEVSVDESGIDDVVDNRNFDVEDGDSIELDVSEDVAREDLVASKSDSEVDPISTYVGDNIDTSVNTSMDTSVDASVDTSIDASVDDVKPFDDPLVSELAKETLDVDDRVEEATNVHALVESEDIEIESFVEESGVNTIGDNESIDVSDIAEVEKSNELDDNETVEVSDVESIDTRGVDVVESDEGDVDAISSTREPSGDVMASEAVSITDRLNNLAKTLIKREVLNVNKESKEVLVKESVKDELGILRAKYSNYKVTDEDSDSLEVGAQLADDVSLEKIETRKMIDGAEYHISDEEEASILETYSPREVWVLTTDGDYVEGIRELLEDTRYRVCQLSTAKDFLVATRNVDNLIVITQKIPTGVKSSLSNYLKRLKTSGLKGRFVSVSDSLVNADIIEKVLDVITEEDLNDYYDTHSRSSYVRNHTSLVDLMRMADFDISDALQSNEDVEVFEFEVTEKVVYDELTFDDDTIELDSNDGDNGMYYTEYGDIDLGKILDN